jgi:O-antigen/teichoic acid export membrane protein
VSQAVAAPLAPAEPVTTPDGSRGGATTTLGSRAARGAAFAAAGQLLSQLLRLASNLVLTHLLEPDAFGLMAIVLAVTMGLQLISDVGVWQAIVRSPRGDDPRFQNTAWTLTTLRGLLLFGVGALCAWPASIFYGRHELVWLLPMCALQALFLGLESSKSALANRHLRVGRIVTMEMASQIVGFVVAVGAGVLLRSVLALALGALASVVTRCVMSHVFLPGPRNRLAWDRSAATEIFSFGGWIFVSTLLFFAGTRWDVFSLGRLEGMGLVGVYGLAQMIVQVPTQIGERVTGFVLMPALAERFRESPAELAADVKRARLLLLPAVAILFLGAAMTAPAFFHLLYRDVYRDAGWMTQLLVLVGWCAFVQDSSSRALLALGDSRSLAVANAARLVATIACSALGFLWASLPGFMIGNALGALLGAVVVGWASLRSPIDTSWTSTLLACRRGSPLPSSSGRRRNSAARAKRTGAPRTCSSAPWSRASRPRSMRTRGAPVSTSSRCASTRRPRSTRRAKGPRSRASSSTPRCSSAKASSNRRVTSRCGRSATASSPARSRRR